ncbi:MAG: hypothetical protein WBA68_06015, partial [Alteraurantiacibacter sp.]
VVNADIVKQMRQEEADLVRKLEAVRVFLSAYGEAPSDSGATPQANRAKSDGSSREKVEITSFTEQTRTSVVLAMQALAMNPKLMKTRELVDFIEAMGHEISGKNKVNALGALLARSADIVGHGKSGWSLEDRDNAIEIVKKYSPKEKEPSSDDAGGSDAGRGSGATPTHPWNQPSDQSAYS